MTTPLQKIAELATVTPGFSPKPTERKKAGAYLLLGGRNIKDGRLVTTDADSYIDVIDRESFRRAIAKPGDLIVSTLFDRRKLYLYDRDDPPAVVNNSCAIIRAGEQSDYIISYPPQCPSPSSPKRSAPTASRVVSVAPLKLPPNGLLGSQG